MSSGGMDEVFNVGLRLDSSGVRAEGEAAGRHAKEGFESGFGRAGAALLEPFGINLEKIKTQVEAIGRGGGGLSILTRNFGEMAVAVTGGLIAFQGLESTIERVTEAGHKFQEMWDGIRESGVGADTFQALQDSAAKAGVSVDAIGPALQRFQMNLSRMALGQGTPLERTMLNLGQGGILQQMLGTQDAGKQLELFQRALQGTSTEGEKLNLVMQAFRSREMLRVFDETGGSIQKVVAHLREMGALQSPQFIKDAAEAHAQFEELSHVVGVKLEAALVKLEPVLTAILGFVNAIASGFGAIVGGIESAAKWAGLSGGEKASEGTAATGPVVTSPFPGVRVTQYAPGLSVTRPFSLPILRGGGGGGGMGMGASGGAEGSVFPNNIRSVLDASGNPVAPMFSGLPNTSTMDLNNRTLSVESPLNKIEENTRRTADNTAKPGPTIGFTGTALPTTPGAIGRPVFSPLVPGEVGAQDVGGFGLRRPAPGEGALDIPPTWGLSTINLRGGAAAAGGIGLDPSFKVTKALNDLADAIVVGKEKVLGAAQQEPRQYFGQLAPWQKARGGAIDGPGTETSDSIPAMLSRGEYVIRAHAVRQVGLPFLDALNREPHRTLSGALNLEAGYNHGGLIPGFAGGGSAPSQGDPVWAKVYEELPKLGAHWSRRWSAWEWGASAPLGELRHSRVSNGFLIRLHDEVLGGGKSDSSRIRQINMDRAAVQARHTTDPSQLAMLKKGYTRDEVGHWYDPEGRLVPANLVSMNYMVRPDIYEGGGSGVGGDSGPGFRLGGLVRGLARGGLITLPGGPTLGNVPAAAGTSPGLLAATAALREAAIGGGDIMGALRAVGAADVPNFNLSGIQLSTQALRNTAEWSRIGPSMLQGVNRLGGGEGGALGSAGTHTLDIRTNAGTFSTWTDNPTIEAIRSSSIGEQLYSTGARPSWFS
jgi:hypothetical protein